MFKNAKLLLKANPLQGKGMYVKRLIASNIALGLVALPTGIPITQTSNSIAQATLIIPQEKLDLAFNITNKENNQIQIPLEFHYMSQGFNIFHPGIDLATDYGTPVKSIKEGVVEEAGYSPFGYGNEILIKHNDGFESLYAHLSKIEVKKGENINLDTEIGRVGLTGRTTGPHLHLEIHKDGKAINPLSILPPIGRQINLLSSNF